MMSKPSAPITCSQPPIDVSVGHTGPPSGEMFIKDESMVLGPAMKWDPTSEFADRNDKSQLICKANSLIDKEEIKPPDTWDLCFPCISAEQPKPVFVQEILMNAEYKAPDVISQLSPADKVAGCDIHLGSTIGCPVKSEPIRDVTPYGSPSYGFLGAPALDDDPLEHCSFVSSQWYLD